MVQSGLWKIQNEVQCLEEFNVNGWNLIFFLSLIFHNFDCYVLSGQQKIELSG